MSALSALLGAPNSCKECGSTALTWFDDQRNTSGVTEGRLRTNEIQSVFVLGCDDCSETLKIVPAFKVAALLNKGVA